MLLGALLVFGCSTAPPTTVPGPGAGVAAAARLREALDGEALYTFAGGLKPLSCGFWHTSIDVAAPDLATVRAVRAQLAACRDEALWADVTVFHEAHGEGGGRRFAQAYVADRAAVARLLHEHAAFFAPYGLAPDTHPAEVLAVVERMPELDRHRGLGLLFGYPLHAIEFFVASTRDREKGAEPTPRRFVQIPTFGAAEGRFVYAVPPDHVDDAADLRLRERAAAILARYRELRATAPADDLEAWLRIVRTLRAEFAPAAAGEGGAPSASRRPGAAPGRPTQAAGAVAPMAAA